MLEASLKFRALSGSLWVILGFGICRGLRLFNHLVLAWFLSPQIFGLMALVKLFMQGLEMFSDVGIGPSIIQNKKGSDRNFLNTAWTLQIIRGFSIWIIACFLTFPFTWWYAQNNIDVWQIVYVLPVAGFFSVISGFNSVSLFTLNKNLKFSKVTSIEIISEVFSLAVMVCWVLIDPSIWAMVAGGLSGAIVKCFLSHFFVMETYRLKLQWDYDSSRELLKFGKWIFLSTAFTFISLNLDKMVLGKLLTLEELGLYSLASLVSWVSLEMVFRLGNSVIFPVYVKFQDNPDMLMVFALRAREVILWAGAAANTFFVLIIPVFFEKFLDARYQPAASLAQWMLIYCWMRILLSTMDRIPLALGCSKSLFLSNIIQSFGIILAMTGYWAGGIVGFIFGFSSGPLFSHIFLIFYLPCYKRKVFVQSLLSTFSVTMVTSISLGGVQWIRPFFDNELWILIITCISFFYLIIGGFVTYRKISLL
jgi:O-antigen/teichoic acid export membrane protein